MAAAVDTEPLDAVGQVSDIACMVRFVSTRELSKQPGRIMRRLGSEGPQVITQNGRPAAYLVPTSGMGIETDLDALRRLLLGRALDAAQADAARAGATPMGPAQIDAEIAAARRERAARATRKPGP